MEIVALPVERTMIVELHNCFARTGELLGRTPGSAIRQRYSCTADHPHQCLSRASMPRDHRSSSEVWGTIRRMKEGSV